MTASEVGMDVYGVRASLRTPLPDFSAFVQKNYASFITQKITSPNITVEYSEDAVEKARAARVSMTSVGGGVYLSKSALYWENEFGFRVLVNFDDQEHWSLRAFHEDLKRKITEEQKLENYQRSMRWILHFPVFSLLSLFHGKILMHASAVVKDDRALLFYGMNKVGKSTLVAHFLNNGYSFMSDNFVLCDKEGIYGFPERLRMGRESVERLQIELHESQTVYGKYHISLVPEKICLTGSPEACFIITNGKKLKISELKPESARMMVAGMHDFLQEFPRYSYLAYLPFFGFSLQGDLPENKKILADTRWYSLEYPMDWNLSKISKEILSCI